MSFSAIRIVCLNNASSANTSEAPLTKRFCTSTKSRPVSCCRIKRHLERECWTKVSTITPALQIDSLGRMREKDITNRRANCTQCSALSKTLWLCLDWACSTAARNHELVRKRNPGETKCPPRPRGLASAQRCWDCAQNRRVRMPKLGLPSQCLARRLRYYYYCTRGTKKEKSKTRVSRPIRRSKETEKKTQLN